MNWTRRCAVTLGLSTLFFLVLANWLGIVPNTANNLIVEAAILTLIGLYAVRVGALGIGIALFLVLFALNADQATIALGLPPLRAGAPDDYWFTTLLPAAAVWLAFPMLARVFARALPRILGGLAIGAALLPLPALRYFLEPSTIVNVYLHPRPGSYAILPVPWLTLVASATMLATVGVVLWEQPAGTARRFARPFVILVASLTVLAPVLDAGRTEAILRSSLYIYPASGGPLTPITVQARMPTDVPRTLLWDDRVITTGAMLEPLRLDAFGGVTRAEFLAGIADHSAGEHRLRLIAGGSDREAVFRMTPPNGLVLSRTDGRVLVRGGTPNADLDLLAVGADGPELLHRRLDASGSWLQPRVISPTRVLLIIAQSGDAWASLGPD